MREKPTETLQQTFMLLGPGPLVQHVCAHVYTRVFPHVYTRAYTHVYTYAVGEKEPKGPREPEVASSREAPAARDGEDALAVACQAVRHVGTRSRLDP